MIELEPWIALIIDISLSLISLIFVVTLFKTFISGKILYFTTFILLFLRIVSYSLKLTIFSSIIDIIFIALLVLFSILYGPDLKKTLRLNKKSAILKSNKINNEFDKSLGDEISTAVLALSASKTGAIMTFVKKDSLDHLIQAGVKIEAPVTSTLLLTIFYNGTPLHDGAVVIKGNIIEAASVYYTPATRALSGRYGARHRAALGVSETCDAITVVVSEETGRISFAINGVLESVSRDDFSRIFEERLED